MNRLTRWCLGRLVPPAQREFVLGDLEEERAIRRARDGAFSASRWYWKAALRAVARTSPLDHMDSASRRHTGEVMQAIVRDSVMALRRFMTQPISTAAAVLTFALGIGANVAMFTVAWPVLAAPLPFPDEDRLTVVSLTYESRSGRARNQVSRGDYLDMRTATAFESMAAFNKYTHQFNLTGRGEPEQLSAAFVTADFFTTLGVRPLTGRLFQPADGPGAGRLFVLSERLWRQRFGADPSVVGSTLRLDGESHQVIGVAPSGASLGTLDADGWILMSIDPGNRMRGAYFLGVIGRLKPDVSLAAANDELAAIMARAAIEFPEFNKILSAVAEPFRERTAESIRTTMALLLASAGMVLAVAIVNLAGLQLARHLERAQEFVVRRALGASPAHLVRQTLTENVVLAAAGGIAGALVALGTLAALESIAPTFGWRQQAPASRWSVALYSAALTTVCGLLVGGFPACRAARSGRAGVGLQARGMTTGVWGSRMRIVVVGTQVAATATLLVAAALVYGSQREVLSVDPGFDFTNTVAADLNVPSGRFQDTPQASAFFNRVIDRFSAIPGVTAVCMTNEVPLDRTPSNMTWVPEGQRRLSGALPTTITQGCIPLLKLTLVSGRWFSETEPVASIVVSEGMARALFRDGRDPVGQRVHLGVPSGRLMTIVGVAKDIHGTTLETAPDPHVWMPQSLGQWIPKRLLVRTVGGAAVTEATLRAALRDVDPELALANVRSLDDILARATAPRRFALFLLGAFAATAVILSALGIYGLLAQIVGQRTREIGLRIALGARPGAIARLVGRQWAVAVGVGMVAGFWAVRAISFMVDALLFQVSKEDPWVYVMVGAGVLLMAGLAAWRPTRRALQIEPVIALRGE